MFVRSSLFLNTRVSPAARREVPHTSNEGSPVVALLSTSCLGFVLYELDLVQDGPDEAAEFSGDGGNGNVTMFSLIEVPELFVESVLGFEGNSDDSGRLSLSSSV
jgi:hypothetical protein